MSAATAAKPRLAIVAGAGALPVRVAEAAARDGRELLIITIEGESDGDFSAWPNARLHWGEVGRLFDLLAEHDCREIVMIGRVARPNIKDVRFDFGAVRTLPRILTMLIGGDGAVMDQIVRFLEEKGVAVRGAHEIAPELVMPDGALGRLTPARQDRADIATGIEVARAIGGFDIGQGVVVSRGRVIAVEAAEGTDAMLRRCAELRQGVDKSGGKSVGKTVAKSVGKGERSGVLVKLPKPRQDLRIDMPTIGVRTIEGAAAAGLAGIAVAAGGTLIAGREEVRRAADEAGLFVVGYRGEG